MKLPEAVRRRPGMYFGELANGAAMHQMLWETLGEAIAKTHARVVRVRFDGACAIVDDDGDGLPVEFADPAVDRSPALEALMTGANRHGLMGVGIAAVCAVSSVFEVQTWRHGRAYAQSFARGETLGALRELGPATRSGTRITFAPDVTIVPPHPWAVESVVRRGRELAALSPGLTLSVDDEEWCYPDGALDHVHHLAGDQSVVGAFRVCGACGGVGLDLAIAWVDSDATTFDILVNGHPTDGPHVTEMFAALREVIGRRVETTQFRSKIERGMVAFESVTVDEPRYRDATRAQLENPEVGPAVRKLVEARFADFVTENPATLDWLLTRRFA